MLTVIAPATATALTTVEAVKAELDLTGTANDAWLADAIARASDQIASWCGRVFARETVLESFRLSRPMPSLALSRWSVAAIAGVTEDGVALDAGAYEVSATDGILYRLNAKGRYLSWPAVTAEVEYTAGWLLPGQVGRNLPGDIEQAAIDLVARAYHARGRDPALRSHESPDVESLAWFDAGRTSVGGLPVEIAGTLARYRMPGMI